MDNSNNPDMLPKTPEEVTLLQEAISQLLGCLTEKWQPCDLNDLTSLEQRAQLLLIAAGMIERRLEMKVEALIASFSAEVEVVATGECGFAEALDPLIRQMWNAFGEAWSKSHGVGPSVHCEIVSDSWRLTDQGVIARNDLARTPFDRQTVFDFVLRQRLFSIRPQVHGAGRMVKMRRTDSSPAPQSPVEPTPVAITNWGDGVRLFAQEVDKVINEAFARKQEAPAPERPVVSIDPPQIVVDGQAYALSDDAAHYLQVLVAHYGERMSDREVIEASDHLQITFENRPRLKSLRESLSPPVAAWLDSNNSGTKLRRPV